MKNTVTRVWLSFAFLMFVGGFATTVKGAAFSDTIWLDRYTILPSGDLQHDSGHLIGKAFRAVLTEIVDPFFVFDLELYRPISGKVIMISTLFDGYKAQGLIPKWGRSSAVYSIGYVTFVTVTPDGFKAVLITPPSQQDAVIPFEAGKKVRLKCKATGTKPIVYQWYFSDAPVDFDHFDEWLSSFTPIADASRKVHTITNLQPTDIGFYYVLVSNGMSLDFTFYYIYPPQ